MAISVPVTDGDLRVTADLLAPALARARTVKAACAAVVDDLAATPGLMPSVYLERGGRLRCQAVTGYWQVFDGMPPGAGVIGSTYAAGEPTVIGDTARSADYLEAVPAVRAEVCVPIRLNGRVAGAINVESERPLHGTETVGRLEHCAAALAVRIGELGGLPSESRPQTLARHAAQLAGLRDVAEIHARVIDAARSIAEMDTAVIAEHRDGETDIVAADGAHAAGLQALSCDVLAEVAGWVRSMSSAYTIGEPTGRGFAGHEALRTAGGEALVVLPLGTADDQRGILLLTDSAPIALDTEDIELLELLAALASTCLASVSALEGLRERAARDPLTGLAHHATFWAALSEACADPPQGRRLALLVVDVDGFKAVNDERGHLDGDRVLLGVARTLEDALGSSDLLCRIGGDEFAALVGVTDEQEALAVAAQLCAAVARREGPRVSIGIGMHRPPEGENPLFARADAAMYRVKRRGGDGVAVG